MARWRPNTLGQLQDASELADRHYRLGAIPVSAYVQFQEQYLKALAAILETKSEALTSLQELEVLTGESLLSKEATHS